MRRAALVTGSTSGVGLGIATALAGAGYDVMLNGFGSASEIESLVADLSAHGTRVLHHGADMSRPAEIGALVQATVDAFGRLDVLVNNAGIQHVARTEAFPAERWDAVLAINLSAAFHSAHAALPHMQQQKWGRIINIASAHGKIASEGKCAYVAAKHGIIGLTKVVALENANNGITANAICPGWVDTPLVRAQVAARAAETGMSEAETAEILVGEKQAMKRFTKPSAIGALAVFLCSDAAETITGSEQVIDGGWTAQ
jgi:3-hydroxybutyrate dehydrogenase